MLGNGRAPHGIAFSTKHVERSKALPSKSKFHLSEVNLLKLKNVPCAKVNYPE